MIARVGPAGSNATAAVPAAGRWRRALADAVSSFDELLAALDLRADRLPLHLRPAEEAARDFPLRVPRSFVARMRRGDPTDPLLLQVLPTVAELETPPGYTLDPLAEQGELPGSGSG